VSAGSSSELSFLLGERGVTRVEIFSPAGRRVRLLREGETPAGTVRLVWDGRSDDGRLVPAGAYFFRVAAGSSEGRVRAVVVR
jgi:flagellar hook assembly protein FlgD